ncbi:UNVERIFIED_CONTAM: hypothetical protein Slati_1626000 [Sesamum latifolium]|uniref:Uncharacterized protein n=1 Tax=Sesamum latifolium TaxID=2727402 RepID=A0AAW2XAL7_9LAMI
MQLHPSIFKSGQYLLASFLGCALNPFAHLLRLLAHIHSPLLHASLRVLQRLLPRRPSERIQNQESDESPVSPKAPDVKNAVTAPAISMAAGTRTGLKITKTGVATASPMRVPTSVIPARQSSVPLMGRRVIMARIWVVEGPF